MADDNNPNQPNDRGTDTHIERETVRDTDGGDGTNTILIVLLVIIVLVVAFMLLAGGEDADAPNDVAPEDNGTIEVDLEDELPGTDDGADTDADADADADAGAEL